MITYIHPGMHLAPPRGPPTTEMRVLSLGISRTGTASMSAAYSILFNAPSYHGGAQTALAGPECQKRWVEIMGLSKRFAADPSTRTTAAVARQKYLLAAELEGFCAVGDVPGIIYAAELRELYPSAKIVVTTRDPVKWWASLLPLVQNATVWWLPYLMLPIPRMRHWPAVIEMLSSRSEEVRGPLNLQDGTLNYHDHMKYLKTVIPEDEIHYFNVTQGWGPLCKILGVDVPDVPFPRENDAQVQEKGFKILFAYAFGLWALILAGLVLGMAILIPHLQRAAF